MNFLDYDEAVPGLPKGLRPDFWKTVVGETIWVTPIFDEELGVVWQPAYAGPFHDKVDKLTLGQILTGVKNEILSNLSSLRTPGDRSEYLDKLYQYFKPDPIRIKAERRAEVVAEFSSEENNKKILGAAEHSRLLIELQSMLEAAYNWPVDNGKFGADVATTVAVNGNSDKDHFKAQYAAIVYIEVAEYLDNAMDDKGKFLPDRNLGGTNDDHFRRYAEAIRSKFGVSFKGSTLEKDHGRRTKGLISPLQRQQAHELLKRHAPAKTVIAYFLELKERQMKQFTGY